MMQGLVLTTDWSDIVEHIGRGGHFDLEINLIINEETFGVSMITSHRNHTLLSIILAI
jgi:hypothetical protein